MIVVNEIHDFEEIPPQVQHFAVSGSKKASATAGAFFCARNKKTRLRGVRANQLCVGKDIRKTFAGFCG